MNRTIFHAVNTSVSCFYIHSELVLFMPQGRSQYSCADAPEPHSHFYTFSATFYPLHTRSSPEAFSSISAFITPLFTANRQPASRQQHSVISLQVLCTYPLPPIPILTFDHTDVIVKYVFSPSNLFPRCGRDLVLRHVRLSVVFCCCFFN